MEQNGGRYRVKVIQSLDEFEKLEAAWNGLIENKKYHVPFLCFDWFRIWFRHFLKGDKLFILLVYEGNNVAAIAPFLIKTRKFKGITKTKKIELIGNFHSHVRNIIVGNLSNDAKRTILETVFGFLQSQYRDWDVIELDSMPEEDENFDVLKDIIAKRGLQKKEYFCFGDWFLDGINYSGDEYIKRRSKNTRSGVGKKARRMEKLGHLEFQVGTEKEKLDHYLELYQQVRKKSWKHPELDQDFLNDVRRMAAEQQCLKFGFLFFNGSPIATLFAIISNRIAYLMEVVYDSQFDEFSPGEIIHGEFIKYLIDADRIIEVDALRGDEPYKKSWTPERRERKGILVFNNNFKGRFLSFLMRKMLPLLRKNQFILSAKNRWSAYLKEHKQK
jgi:CelD/BcsL family acetyltransferase involved in cellulose biosynthesis